MTNKIQKIREGIKKLKSQLLRGSCSSQVAMETRCKEEAYNEVLAILDSMQEEPVSEEWIGVAKQYVKEHVIGIDKVTFSIATDMFISGAKWQKQKDESTTEDLGEYINELSKQFPEVSFAKLSRIAVRVAKWQKSQDQSTIELAEDHAMLAGMEKMEEEMMKNIWKPADGEDLPEIDREVIALLDNGKVVFAHRPNPNGWDGISITTLNIEHYTPKTYGKGGWNVPDVKYWLDVKLLKE